MHFRGIITIAAKFSMKSSTYMNLFNPLIYCMENIRHSVQNMVIINVNLHDVTVG